MALVKLTIKWFEKVLGGKLEGYKEVTRDEHDVFLERSKDALPQSKVEGPEVEVAPDGAKAAKPKASKPKAEKPPKNEEPTPKKNAAKKKANKKALSK